MTESDLKNIRKKDGSDLNNAWKGNNCIEIEHYQLQENFYLNKTIIYLKNLRKDSNLNNAWKGNNSIKIEHYPLQDTFYLNKTMVYIKKFEKRGVTLLINSFQQSL